MSTPAKLLVVANRTADSDELHAALVRRAQDGPVDVTLLAPAACVAAPERRSDASRSRGDLGQGRRR